jgi:DNA-binding CsgD family transcriptional regulator
MRLGQSAAANRQFALIFQQRPDRPFVLREVLTTYIFAIQNSYWQDNLAEARRHHRQGTLLAQRLQDDELLSLMAGLGALYTRDTSLAPGAEQPGDVPTILSSHPLRPCIQIDLLVRAGRAEEAWRLAESLGVGLDSDPAGITRDALLAYLRAYIARGVNRAALTPLISGALAQRQRAGERFDEAHLLALRAWKQLKMGRRRAATDFLQAAVRLALETGYLRVVLDIPDLLPLLELGGDPPIRVRAVTNEPEQAQAGIVLTPQEASVLKLLEQDYRYEQIAAEMTISINTVQTHIRNLYAKLDVKRRAQALARARELGLI